MSSLHATIAMAQHVPRGPLRVETKCATFQNMPKSRKAQAIRSNVEFNLAQLQRQLVPPRANSSAYAWDLAAIAQAKTDQLAGNFSGPCRLAKAMRGDDAIYSAWQTRLSPEAALGIEISAAGGVRGEAIAGEGEALFGSHGVGLRPETRQDILDDLVNHGIGIAYNVHKPREDGARVDIEVTHWPLEHVRWDSYQRKLLTRVDAESGGLNDVPITHGDGSWIVFRKTITEPWAKHAAVLPASLVWSRHAFGIKDWTSASYSHGNAKVKGELPPEFAFLDKDGALTPQASAFLEILKAAAGVESMAAIVPPGAKMDMLANPSTAHQIWTDIINNSERAAQRIYNGTDAALGSPGGAPGVDILSLFGVSNTIGEGDLRALERGFQEGAIDVWAAINFGDSSLAPRFAYLIPNADEQAERAAYATRIHSLLDALAKIQGLGLVVTPDYLRLLCERFDVDVLDLAPAAPVPLPSATARIQAPTAARKI
jgi:hypothetical protein